MKIQFTKRPKKISKQAFHADRNFNSKHSEILEHTFDSYNVVYIGERDSDGWEHDAFSVSINGIDFSYNTGFGHRTLEKYHTIERLRKTFVHAPIIDDVLFSLVMDALYGSETFGDFCADFGYDEDSRKVLKIYLECQKTADKIRRLLPVSLDKAIDLFSDY